MTKHSEILTMENPPREAFRPRRIQPRFASKQEESKPRFRLDSTTPCVQQDRPDSPMRVLLRNAKTMKFFRSAERWTKDPRQARDFHNGWWATVCAFTMNPRHLVIHYEFDDARYNLHIPVVGHSQT